MINIEPMFLAADNIEGQGPAPAAMLPMPNVGVASEPKHKPLPQTKPHFEASLSGGGFTQSK
jgi:hypothetical protein